MSTVARFVDHIQLAPRSAAPAARPAVVDPAEQLAAAFAHARTEGYAAGMDDAAAELAELKEKLLATQEAEQEAHRQEARRQQQAFEEAVNALQRQHAELMAQAHELAVELGYQAACVCIGQRATERRLLADLVRDALDEHPEEGVRLRLGRALHALAEMPADVEAVADPSLDSFGVVVEGRRGQRASSLEQRLRALADALLNALETSDERAP